MLPIITFFQVLLGAIQSFLGHTIQGPFYWLGERALNVSSPNVAKAYVFGQTMLRSYGTFSHPNVLAGWLVVALLIVIYQLRLRKMHPPIYTLLFILSTILAVIGILLTQSRTAALSLFGIVLPFCVLRSLRSRVIYFFVLLSTLSSLLLTHSSPLSTLSMTRFDLSISERLNLQQISLKIVRSYPLFGTGANASLSTYPQIAPSLRLLQPDHDSFTLFLSWFGVFGILTFLYVSPSIIHDSYFILPLIPLLFFDHYVLTSPQGLFIVLLYLRLFSSKN